MKAGDQLPETSWVDEPGYEGNWKRAICKFKGHRWPDWWIYGHMRRMRHCHRCLKVEIQRNASYDRWGFTAGEKEDLYPWTR